MDSRIVLRVAEPDAWLSPVDGALLAVLVGKGESLLGTQEALPVREELDIEVVQHDIFGGSVPVVDIE